MNVCTKYCGTTILLAECNTEEEAEEFMKHDYVLYYSDEIEDDEDVVISHDEMFICEDIHFYEPMTKEQFDKYFEDYDDLPF